RRTSLGCALSWRRGSRGPRPGTSRRHRRTPDTSARLSQLWFDHFASWVARQGVEESHRSRDLEIRQMLTRIRDHGRLVEFGARQLDDECLADLAQPLVWHSNDRGFGHPVQPGENLFDLGWIHVEATADGTVLDPGVGAHISRPL